MSDKLTFQSTISLNANTKLPRLGFGVWDSPKHLTVQSCLEALKVGYRHIDGAQVYGNEAEVGQAVKQSSVPRSDIFITSKVLAPKDSDEETYQQCLQRVNEIAGKDGYLDLFLIHNGQAQGKENVKKLWKQMEKLQEEGKFKAIGMSNTGVGLLEGMKEYAKITPAVNQLEVSLSQSLTAAII
jgi:diketogulonate reductase-like aldo/keto reductase